MHFGGRPARNLFVAGEMMAGNVLGKGYTAGVGMTHRHGVRTDRRRTQAARRASASERRTHAAARQR